MKFAPRISGQYAGGSRQLIAKRQKLLTADLRGLSQIMIHRGGAEKPAGSEQRAAGSNSDYGLQDSKQQEINPSAWLSKFRFAYCLLLSAYWIPLAYFASLR